MNAYLSRKNFDHQTAHRKIAIDALEQKADRLDYYVPKVKPERINWLLVALVLTLLACIGIATDAHLAIAEFAK